MNLSTRIAVGACILLTACSQTRRRQEVRYEPAPVASQAAAESPRAGGELGSFQRPISTRSPEAQRLFDQALVLTYAFDHDEAIRRYEQAARLDPASPMPWWGIALANGPHINNAAMPPERVKAAWSALEKARGLAPAGSPVERALIDALGKRYSPDEKAERRPLDEAYAAAMRVVWRAHPDDRDAGTLFAESMMDLRPWDLWTIDGKPKPGTEEIVATLEAVLARWPDHPGANHLYIHAVEASPDPGRALAAADRLTTLVPGTGHLVHMPSHIYIRVGRYADASRSNEQAIEVDERNAPRVAPAGFYRIYMTHNRHFLTFASMMEGRSAAALESARQMVERIPAAMIEQQAAIIDGFLPTVFHVFVRFGKWDAILAEPAPRGNLPVSVAVRHYARGIALAALDRVGEAEKEQVALADAVKRVGPEIAIGNNPAPTVLGIPVRMLAAEIAFRKGRHDESFSAFRDAIAIEDSLVYDEPPDWMQPVRHAYGASLLAAKRFEEAERVFKEDLRRFPGNGWSLTGLLKCLRARGATAEAAEAAQLERAWQRADVAIASPCFCQPG